MGRLVIVPDDNVPCMEHFIEDLGPNKWLVFPRSGKATRATTAWKRDTFSPHGNTCLLNIYDPVAVE